MFSYMIHRVRPREASHGRRKCPEIHVRKYEIVECLSRKTAEQKFDLWIFGTKSSLTCSFGPTPYPRPTSKTRDVCETVDVMFRAEKEVGVYLVSTLFLTAKLYQSLKNTLFSGPRGKTGHCHQEPHRTLSSGMGGCFKSGSYS